MCSLCNTNAEMIPVSTVWWIVIAAILSTLLLSWILFHHFWFNKKTYPKFCQRIEYFIEWLSYWLQRLWYALIFIGSTTFIVLNFEKCSNLTFSSKFNGFNAIFVFWLVILLLPLFEKFEGFGVNIKFRHQAEVSNKAATNAMNTAALMDVNELDKLHKAGGSNE